MKETNHLVIRKNTIRNVGVVRRNHTIIEKEIRYKRPVQRSKVVGYVVQEYQTVYKPAIVYVPYTYPVRYSVPHHYYPKQYHYPQHHYQPSCCQQQHQYPQPVLSAARLLSHWSAAVAQLAAPFFIAHDLVRKPVPTFRDHALYSGARNDSSFFTRKS